MTYVMQIMLVVDANKKTNSLIVILTVPSEFNNKEDSANWHPSAQGKQCCNYLESSAVNVL